MAGGFAGLFVTWLPGADAVPARQAGRQAGRRRVAVVAGYEVVIGVDVGKHTHHACGFDVEGQRLLDQEVAASETAMREVFESAGGHGEVLVGINHLHSIGVLAVTLVQSIGLDVAYLLGLSVRRSRICIRECKTDARDFHHR